MICTRLLHFPLLLLVYRHNKCKINYERRDSDMGVFVWILNIATFYRTPLGDCFRELNLETFITGGKPFICKKNSKTVTLKTDRNLFSRLLSVTGKLVCKLFHHMTFVLFYRSWLYPNGADMMHTTKSNLLNEIQIKRYSLSSLMGILILVQLLLILWQFYNLFITTCSKNFLM